MKPNKTILIVCRSMNEVHFLSCLRPHSEYRYVLASDDIRVHRAVEKYPWVNNICWIEQMESFYHVANDVIRLVEVVNRWLKSLGDDNHGIPTELLFWICHVEGGMTSQRIQDALLLIRSYLYLLDTNKISSVIIFSHPRMRWENDVLIETARSKGIDSQVIGRFRINVLMGEAPAFLKTIAREPYYIFNFMRAKFCSRFRSMQAASYEKEIVIQLCSSEYKHSENIIPLMKALKDKKYNPVALCWRAFGGADRVRREGLRAEELEKLVPVSSLWTGYYRTFQSWKKAKSMQKKFQSLSDLQYQSVPLGRLLWPSIQFFFKAELLQRYRLQLAIRKYFKSHSPFAIKLWGGGTLFEGDIVLKNLSGDKKPLLLVFWLGHVIDYPYQSNYDYIDLFLAAGKSQTEHMKKLGISSNRIVSVGISRYDHLSNFKKKYSPAQSRFYLGIPDKFLMYILFDSNAVLRGFFTAHEHIQILDSLLNFMKNNPSMGLIIKPHPSHYPGILESLIDFYSLPNVVIVNKNMAPYHAINASNLLITKFSTIGIEAMIFERPVVSVILDGQMRWRSYGDAAEYVTSIEELNMLLIKLADDSDFRNQWTMKQIKNQKEFLKDYFDERKQSSSELGAEAIDQFILKTNTN